LLEREGFEVREAVTARDALPPGAVAPDLILLNLRQAEADTSEASRMLQQDARTRSIPVLHVVEAPEARSIALDCGAAAYLTRPVEPAVLVATVRTLLRARHAEDGAREAARVWQTTFDAIGHGLCLIDAGGIVRQVNRAMCSILGQPPEHLIGRPHDAPFEGTELSGREWIFDRVRRSLRPESTELEVRGRWFHVTVDPLFEAGGEFAGAIRTVIDISDQKRADAERERLLRQLESERARLEAVLGQMPAGVIMAEAPEGTLVLRNELVEAIFRGPFRTGGGAGDYLQYAAFYPEGRAYTPQEFPLARTLASGESVLNEEICFARSDGSHATVLVSSVPVRDREGHLSAAMAVLHDVSDRHEMESRLRRSEKMEAMARLAGGAAHDFNNLLTIIGGYGQMALEALDARSPLRNDLEAILEASGRAGDLTRQLLTFSRRQMVQPRIVDLNRHVTKISRMLRRVLGKEVTLVTALDAPGARIRLDLTQLDQVLLNISVNAHDAMPGGGTLTIATSLAGSGTGAEAPSTLAPGRYVLLSMSDTGTGMDEETLSHVFEPFFTTKARGKGTGLGLSSVYGIVKQAGGEIVVDSKPGCGTTIRMYFPARGEKVRASARKQMREIAAATGTETILLVEDDAEVRRLASQMLTRQGYTVIEACSGPEALGLWSARSAAIHLLLTDVIMPDMSGPRLVEKILALDPALRIMYMSGYADDVIARHGVVGDKTAFLHKPFTLDTLAAMVRSVLDAGEPAR
jgi:PAS domain S-box-containing protein